MTPPNRRARAWRIRIDLCSVLSLLGLLLISAAPFTAAALPIYESAPNGPLATMFVSPSPYGDPPPVIVDDQSVGVKFHTAAPVTTGSIGGYFGPYGTVESDIIGAIVRLDGPSDFPDSFDLTTSDVLGKTTIHISTVAGNYAGELALTLTGGWYALVFAATGSGDDNNALMPRMTADIGDPLYFLGRTITDAGPTGGFEYFDGGGLGGARMFVDSDPVAAVPEPSTLLLLGSGLAGLGGAAWRRSRRT